MLDINELRNNLNEITQKLKTRNKDYPALSQFKKIDNEWRTVLNKIQELNTKRNQLTEQIATLISQKRNSEIKAIKTKVQKIKEQLTDLELEEKTLNNELNFVVHSIPNIPHSSVPIGKDENDNKEVRRWGTPTNFDFEFLPHWDIATNRDFVDFERAAKLSGSRFTIYRGNGAKLIRALQWLTLDINTKAGFFEMLPPVVLNGATLVGTGQLPKFEEDLFKLGDGRYLSPTSEVQLTSFYSNEFIDENKLPLMFTANTACFRSEAGSAGKDTKGVIRQHQFYKTEMVILSKPESSYDALEMMVKNAESILQALNLPYRTIVLCTGDQGFSAAKTYDIEVWLPSYNAYKEISSCSNCEDFQARNLKIRFKDSKNDNKTTFVHTLNGSGLAIDRLWAAVVENYQQKDGRIKLPEVLRKYFDEAEYI